MHNKTFYIIGFMASGKTSLSKKLAKAFGYKFIDLDTVIEKDENLSINELFEKKGENYFREKEVETLRKVDSKNAFIATGGGMPCHSQNIDFMKKNGVVIYLKTPAEILLGRLRENKETRPLIAKLEDEQLQEFIVSTLDRRQDFYEQADIIVPHYKSFAKIKMELGLIINEL